MQESEWDFFKLFKYSAYKCEKCPDEQHMLFSLGWLRCHYTSSEDPSNIWMLALTHYKKFISPFEFTLHTSLLYD